jgi:hypothetical protein
MHSIWQAILNMLKLDVMLGKATADPPLRNMQRMPIHTGGGYRGVLVKAELMKFWGPGIADLRTSLMLQHEKHKCIKVNIDEDAFVSLRPDDVASFIPGIISYDTQVKGYSQQKYIEWSDVPDDLPREGFVPEAWRLGSPTSGWWPVVELKLHKPLSEEPRLHVLACCDDMHALQVERLSFKCFVHCFMCLAFVCYNTACICQTNLMFVQVCLQFASSRTTFPLFACIKSHGNRRRQGQHTACYLQLPSACLVELAHLPAWFVITFARSRYESPTSIVIRLGCFLCPANQSSMTANFKRYSLRVSGCCTGSFKGILNKWTRRRLLQRAREQKALLARRARRRGAVARAAQTNF